MFFYTAKQIEKHNRYNCKFKIDFHTQRHEDV